MYNKNWNQLDTYLQIIVAILYVNSCHSNSSCKLIQSYHKSRRSLDRPSLHQRCLDIVPIDNKDIQYYNM